ncbi:MAG TPA: zinc-ribbon domain-containing protein [Longimicrobiales bacterium]|nr:zinc-ribbon domain-containing protein [Longimicrobiales bacterium]
MNIRCPECQTVFRVDPSRIPPAGVRARCSRCGSTFSVKADAGDGAEPTPAAAPQPRAGDAPAAPAAPRPTAPSAQASPASAAPAAAEPPERAAPVAPAAQAAPAPAASAAPSQAAQAPAAPAGQATLQSLGPRPTPSYAPAAPPPPPAPRAAPTPAPAEQRPAVFGSRDPNARAQRIARALVSDIVAYHPKRRDACLEAGTLRTEFREEIMKSWEEYVAQVGLEMAKSTPYFRDALNAILANGQNVF